MRIAVYGGSFNPPHVAHAMVVSWLQLTGIVDEVWLVPVFEHAFEKIHNKRLFPFEDRVTWCRLMAGDIGAGVQVSTIESELPTPSFSIDTLRALQARFPEYQFRLVVGADVVEHLPNWKDWAHIEAEFSPIIVGRVGYEGHQAAIQFPNISSTEIRRHLQQGLVTTQWLTQSVSTFFQEHIQRYQKVDI